VEFIGGLAGLFGTGYGRIALVKLGLFIVLLTLAALNRLTLTDRLAASSSEAARRHMRISIATEGVLGALVVIAAGFLASHMPGTHEQPVWPFAWRPSLSIWDEPELRNELLFAAFAVGTAVLVAINGLIWRKLRWPAMLLAVIILALAIPHLDMLFVTSYPTSFFSSPTEFAATAIARGERLFTENCTACHGPQGHGDGLAVKPLPQPAADLTAEHFWTHSEGDLFWFISNGIEAPNGSKAMPGFAAGLSSEARWDLIDYLRARNAGESMRAAGRWSHPLQVPQFDATCADGRTVDLDDLRGRVLHIVAVDGEDANAPASSGGTDVTTIILSRTPAARPDAASCATLEPEAWTAFAILLGVPSDAFAGAQLLVDRNGWLRAAWRPGEPGDWTNPQALAAVVSDITANPIVAGTSDGHLHHQ
jgi:mono/diheme cytochrome c family protein